MILKSISIGANFGEYGGRNQTLIPNAQNKRLVSAEVWIDALSKFTIMFSFSDFIKEFNQKFSIQKNFWNFDWFTVLFTIWIKNSPSHHKAAIILQDPFLFKLTIELDHPFGNQL